MSNPCIVILIVSRDVINMKLNARQELKKTSLSPTAREALGKPKLSFLHKSIFFHSIEFFYVDFLF